MRTAWFTALALGVASAADSSVTPAPQSRKTPQTARPRPKPRPRPQPTRPPTGRPMEERVADLERENAKLRQTLQPPAPAPTGKQQGGDARQDEDAKPPAPMEEHKREVAEQKPKAEPPTRKAECLLASVPRKELSACVLANGFCVGSPTECTDLGGRYDSKGCGGGGDCACCEGIPEEPTRGRRRRPRGPDRRGTSVHSNGYRASRCRPACYKTASV